LPGIKVKPQASLNYLAAVTGVAAATAVFWLSRAYLSPHYVSLLYLSVVVASATSFGIGPAVLAAVLSFLCWNFFFIQPVGTFYIHDPKELIALLVFLVVGIVCGVLAGRARLAEQMEALREANKLKSALLSSVSHDLRTPLCFSHR